MARLTEVDFFRAGLELAGEQGTEALTISALCERLRVTKGSFYHHFSSFDGFVDGLLLYWEAEDGQLGTAMRAEKDPRQRIARFVGSAAELPHRVEAALRGWARNRGDVATVLVRVDRRRERTLTDAIAALDVERGVARVLARGAVNLLIGTQVREEAVDTRQLRQMLSEWTRLVTLGADLRLSQRVKVID